jgi:hypothetical protein
LLTLIGCIGFPAGQPALAAPAATSRPANMAPAIVRSDLATLYRTLREAHFDLYAHRPESDYDRLYASMMASIHGPMTPVAVATMFQKFVAYGRIGHARIDQPVVDFVHYLGGGGKLLPVFVRVDGGKVLLTEAAEPTGTLRAGTEITAIGGVPIRQMLDRLGAYVSAERPYMAYALMEESFPALLWMDRGPIASILVTANIAGKSTVVRVDAVTLAQRKALRAKFPSPQLATDFATREYRTLIRGSPICGPGPFSTPNSPRTAPRHPIRPRPS